MIVVFESKRSVVLDSFLDKWEFPEKLPFSLKNIFTLMALNTYFYRKVFRFGDLVVMDMEGFFEQAAKYALFFTVAGMFVAVYFDWFFLLSTSFFLVILFMALVSPNFRSWMVWLKLKLSGHKERIVLVSRDYAISKIVRVVNGAV